MSNENQCQEDIDEVYHCSNVRDNHMVIFSIIICREDIERECFSRHKNAKEKNCYRNSEELVIRILSWQVHAIDERWS